MLSGIIAKKFGHKGLPKILLISNSKEVQDKVLVPGYLMELILILKGTLMIMLAKDFLVAQYLFTHHLKVLSRQIKIL